MGPWPNFEACMMDPSMAKRYDDETRKKVCGALKARLEAQDSLAVTEANDGRFEGKVTRGDGYAILHDAVAAREGVNANHQLKPWTAIKNAADTLAGAPLIYSHPRDAQGRPIIRPPPELAVGHAVNERLDENGRRLLYDALLYLKRPEGSRITDEDLERNERAVKIVEDGGTIDNSVGYYALSDPTPGSFQGVAYREKQVRLDFGHVALLRPLTNEPGACPAPQCGLGVDSHPCAGGEVCCKTRAQKAVESITTGLGVSERAALAGIVAATRKA